MNTVYDFAKKIEVQYTNYKNNISREAELNHLPDSILEDIGVSRSNIHNYIWK